MNKPIRRSDSVEIYPCGCPFNCRRDFLYEGRHVFLTRRTSQAELAVEGLAETERPHQITRHHLYIDAGEVDFPGFLLALEEETFDRRLRDYLDTLLRQGTI
jgi:hypothetical protein